MPNAYSSFNTDPGPKGSSDAKVREVKGRFDYRGKTLNASRNIRQDGVKSWGKLHFLWDTGGALTHEKCP